MTKKLGVVALYAGRIRFWAKSVEQAHLFGSAAGDDDQPWELPFQRQAAKIYRDILPETYLERLASVFLGCSLTMEDHAIPGSLAEDWNIVFGYLSNASQAIAEEMGFDLYPVWNDPTDHGEPTTPAVVRFDMLAGFVSLKGVQRLQKAGDNVATHLLSQNTKDAPLTDMQVQILGDLAEGVKVIDIAVNRGFSSRNLYREFNVMWDTLGVSNKQQAIALAVENGWIISDL